jgi:hypothetical protein
MQNRTWGIWKKARVPVQLVGIEMGCLALAQRLSQWHGQDNGFISGQQETNEAL